MRTLLRLVVLLLLLVGLITLWESLRTVGPFQQFAKSTTRTDQAVVLQRVTALGKLELVRYTFKDIVEHELVRSLLPNAHAVLIVEGEATGCIDLTKLMATDLQASPSSGDTLLVTLPQPELCGWKINHQRSRIYDTQYTFLDEAQLLSEAYRRAETQIQQSALSSGILPQTRHNADQILRPVLERIAGRPVVLRYDH